MGNRFTRGALRTLGVGALGVSLVYSAGLASAADHLDAPGVTADGRTDINDLYVFQSPDDDDNTVLVMTVNPGAGAISGTTFHPDAEYTFNIDEDGDAVADREITIDFKKAKEKGQKYKVLVDGHKDGKGRVGEEVDLDGLDGEAMAGVFEDPFFFDLAGFQNGFAFTGDDFFAPLNVSAIVLEVETEELSEVDNISVWATTSIDGVQIDRIGRPAINTVLIPSDRKDEFNVSDPADDFANFGDDVQATIESLNGGDTATAAALTGILLPDVLTVDTSNPAGFLNGRGLADDVIDAELGLLTNGAVTTDLVDANNVPFDDEFPYLAP
ncbi:MAG: DUF4331 family protein, partial [Acidimicrobiales bacterium]